MFHVKRALDWLIRPILKRRLAQKIETINDIEKMLISAGGHGTEKGMYLIGTLQHHYDERDALFSRLAKRRNQRRNRRRYERP